MNKSPKKTEFKRIKIVITVISLIFIIFVIYLSYFQVFKAKEIADNPYNQRLTAYERDIERGRFFDRNGEALVTNSKDDMNRDVRFYQYPRLYCHILGYDNLQYGKTGLERSLNNVLLNIDAGTPIQQLQSWIRDNTKGNDVVLTLDTGLQSYAYNLLEGHKGSIVALNPKTGEVYAMMSRPTFDPNTLENNWDTLIEEETSPLLNRATQGLYTPGSVFKVVTATSLLEHPEIDQNYYDDGEFTVDGYTIRNYDERYYGDIDLSGALIHSVNTYFADKALKIGATDLNDMAERFYLGERIPFDIPTEASVSGFTAGSSKTEIASAAFGQGKTLVTPLNMALISGAVANDGMMMQPYIVKEIISEDGETLKETKPVMLRQSTMSTVSRELKEHMVSTIDAGSLAAIPGVRVGGKTGTAETTSGLTHAWFIAFAPADDPVVAVAVVLEEDGTFGATTAAPIAREIMNYVLYQIGN